MKKSKKFENLNSYTDKEDEFYMKNKKKESTGRKVGRIIAKTSICLISVIFVAAGLLSLYAANFVFAELSTKNITNNKEELGITSGTVTVEHITNIALFGVDTRYTNSFKGRSDVIMILSIDEIHNKVKLTSVLRDTRVYMGSDYNKTSTDYDKINHAYIYYGPEYAIKVLNQNFGLDIQDYVTVNFAYMADIIDYFGGVDIDITSNEAYYINIHKLSGPSVSTKGGVTHLSGVQAVSYARNRTIGGDDARAERQRKVLEKLIEKIIAKPVTEYPAMIAELSSMVELSLDVTKILAFTPFVVDGFTVEANSVPKRDEDNAYTGFFEGGASMWEYDREEAALRVQEFIYEGEGSESYKNSE